MTGRPPAVWPICAMCGALCGDEIRHRAFHREEDRIAEGVRQVLTDLIGQMNQLHDLIEEMT